MRKKRFEKKEYNSRLAIEARRQLALMNRSRVCKGGNGAANQPFYTQFLNR